LTKYTENIVHQVGYIYKIYRDARSTRHKIQHSDIDNYLYSRNPEMATIEPNRTYLRVGYILYLSKFMVVNPTFWCINTGTSC